MGNKNLPKTDKRTLAFSIANLFQGFQTQPLLSDTQINDYVLVIAAVEVFESAFPSLVLCLAMGSWSEIGLKKD